MKSCLFPDARGKIPEPFQRSKSASPCAARNNISTPAFTLTELLLSMAIIGLLAGLLLPALNRAHQAGHSSVCINHMRQIELVIHLYAENNGDEFPRSQHSAFAYGLLPWERTIAPELGSSSQCWTNLLNSVYRCPSNWRGKCLSYGLNCYFELEPKYDDYIGSPQTWRRISSVPRPASTILLAETPPVVDHVMPHFWDSPQQATDVDHHRHGKRSNYGFVDGHVGALEFKRVYDLPTGPDLWNPSLAR